MPLSLFPYQEQGATWIAQRERSGLLDLPGLGKSAQTVRALDLRRSKRGVIISPAHLRSNWRKEIDLFTHLERRVAHGRTLHDFVAWSRGIFDVLLLSYEMATRWKPHFDSHAEFLDFITFDEFHYLGNPETKRTVALLGEDCDGGGGLLSWGCQAFFLTGTLMPNDPANCYTFLRAVRAIDMPYGVFTRRYFSSRASTWGQRNRPKPVMLEELQMLIQRNSIRRTFDEVGIQLPPIFLTTTLVDGDTDEVRRLLAATPGLERAVLDSLERGGLSNLRLAGGEDDGKVASIVPHIATLRRLIAEAKAVPYAEMLISELEADPDRKVVVMGISRDALIRIRDALARRNIWCVLLQGGSTERQRDEMVTAFQSNSNCRVFIGNIVAAGTGLTLTAAAHVDMFEYDWRPANNDQAIKRIRRIGQTRTQHARFITLARSIDEVVATTVAEKTRNIAMVEGDSMITGPAAE